MLFSCSQSPTNLMWATSRWLSRQSVYWAGWNVAIVVAAAVVCIFASCVESTLLIAFHVSATEHFVCVQANELSVYCHHTTPTRKWNTLVCMPNIKCAWPSKNSVDGIWCARNSVLSAIINIWWMTWWATTLMKQKSTIPLLLFIYTVDSQRSQFLQKLTFPRVKCSAFE